MKASIVLLGPVILATILPGPSMLLALDHGLRYGSRGAVATAMGNVAATALQAALVLAGLGAVALASGRLLACVRLGGALYLCYLGLRTLGGGRGRPNAGPRGDPAHGWFGRFRQAAFVTLGNPAALVFFTAFFPPFLGPAWGRGWVVLHLVVPILAVTFLCMMLYARFGQGLVHFLGAPVRARAFRFLLGAGFLGMGGWLAWHG